MKNSIFSHCYDLKVFTCKVSRRVFLRYELIFCFCLFVSLFFFKNNFNRNYLFSFERLISLYFFLYPTLTNFVLFTDMNIVLAVQKPFSDKYSWHKIKVLNKWICRHITSERSKTNKEWQNLIFAYILSLIYCIYF